MLSPDSWVSLLREKIVPPDMSLDVSRAFFYHLADKKIFESGGEGMWRLTDLVPDETLGDALASRIEGLMQTDKIMPYFIRAVKDLPDIFSLQFKVAPADNPHRKENISDLSNLQIVKKVGRQLEPFIEFEKNFLGYVSGPNTSKESARILLNYVLERTRGKIKPSPWKQLSRRRHK